MWPLRITPRRCRHRSHLLSRCRHYAWTPPPFNLCLEVVGIDRILFSVDYPYSPNEAGREFLEKITLAPVDCEKFTHANAEKLLKIA